MPLSIHVELLELEAGLGQELRYRMSISHVTFPPHGGPLGFHFQKIVRLFSPATGQVSD